MDDRDLKRGSTVEARRSKATRLTLTGAFWFVVPVAIALVLVGYGRYNRVNAAAAHMTEVARIAADKGYQRSRGQCAIPADDVDAIAAEVVRAQYGDKPEPPEPAARARSLARTMVNDLVRRTANQRPEKGACASPLPDLERDIRFELLTDLGVTIALIGIMLTSVAGLFIADLYRARRELRDGEPKPGERHASLRSEIACERDWRILERPSVYFSRRLGFLLLLAEGANYLLAPLGQMASIVGDYEKLHPAIGATSAPYFIEQVGSAQPVTIGFCGFMVYSLLTLADRANKRDLDDRLFASLLNRGIVVFILSLVLAGVTDGGPVSRALIFLAGVFPQTGIDAIAKMARLKVEQVTSDETAGFEVLRDLNLPKQLSLRELGVTDANDLARCDLSELILKVGFEPGVLVHAVDQAVLVHTFGTGATEKLERVPIFTATQMLDYVGSPERDPKHLADVLEALAVKDIEVQIGEIERSASVRWILRKRAEYAPPAPAPAAAEAKA
jgi:hypothetical protein